MVEISATQAVQLLQRRRMQNKQSQQRYRDKMRRAKGASPNAGSSLSSSTSEESSSSTGSKHEQEGLIVYQEATLPFYGRLSRMLDPTLEVERPLVPPPRLGITLTLKAHAFVDVVPMMAKAFNVSTELITDKTAFIDPSRSWRQQGAVSQGAVYCITSTSEGFTPFRWEDKPSTMAPTIKQLTKPHPIGMAIAFPWPSLRDKMIDRVGEAETGLGLCHDLSFGGGEGADWQPSFTIWGEDFFDPLSWEVGQYIYRKYTWMFDQQIVDQSNWWRNKRGLPALTL